MNSLFKIGKYFITLFISIKIIPLCIFILVIPFVPAHAQVAISTDGSSPNGSAMLHIKSTNKGVLLPRLTFAQVNAITAPVEGLMVYCYNCSSTGTGVISIFQGGLWKVMPLDCLVPNAPSPGTNIPTVNQITWNWNPVSITLGYKWNTVNDFSTATDVGNNTTFTNTGLACWTSYTRYVWAYNACGPSAVMIMTASTSQVPFSPCPTTGTHVAALNQITWNWNTVAGAIGYKWGSTNNFTTATDLGTVHSLNETSLACGTSYTRYVWAYNTCGYSTPIILTKSTLNCWTCGVPITKNHVTGDVAPVNKATVYGTTSGISGESTKCWITSNLGSDHQALTVDDATEASAGWYWQFNLPQGFKHDGTNRTPNSTWISIINEYTDWGAANDPCAIELGNNWRIPTNTEWTNVDASNSWVNWDGPWNSLLKMHAAGRIYYNDASLGLRGVHGAYWSSSQGGSATYGYSLYFFNNSCVGNIYYKSMGFSIRCIRD